MDSMTLTKTRFRMALECPRKLDYARDESYYDAHGDDDFLASLAEGGHQVGELARQMYPAGHLVSDDAADDQVGTTRDLLSRPNVTVFEGTIRYGNLLVRCDVLEKIGNEVKLIEVKAKGCDHYKGGFTSETPHGDSVAAKWRPYVYDVAYQVYVFSLAYPHLNVTPYLMLLDKTAPVSIPGLNTRLPVKAVDRRVTVMVKPSFDATQLAPPVLRLVDVTNEVNLLREQPIDVTGEPQTFEMFVDGVSATLNAGASFPVKVGGACKKCEFYVDPADVSVDKRSGWAECMEQHTHAPVNIRRSETVFGLYRLTPKALAGLLAAQPLALANVPESAFDEVETSPEQITLDQRRQLQWLEAHARIDQPFVLREPLEMAMTNWRWPLHFIDFETSRPALPYHANRKPYDQILFQFSHHVLDRSGRLEHRTEFIEATPGVASSVPVLRKLKEALSADDGTVIHWWTHEATVLKDIRTQLDTDQPAGFEELVRFVDSMIGTKGRLADLGKIVSRTAFYPGTGGSSSIKKVLPAALRHSAELQRLYGAQVYGTAAMPSKNFKNKRWVVMDKGSVQDPYELLGPLFSDPDIEAAVGRDDADDDAGGGDFIKNGGAAIIAYDQLQQPDLPQSERMRLTTQLLRYCELDTLAMVMVYQSLTGHGV
jgi:hypothetical protein